MKTLNYNENCRYGQNIEVSINTYEGAGRINVNAACRNEERSTTVTLEYNAETGARVTEVSDYSAPFDNAFYTDLDAKVLKVASAIANTEEA